jgi:hypothetical protein
MTSSLPPRLHVDRGFQRHGYPWVPTDQCLNRPQQAGPTYQKTRRPVSGPPRPDMWAQDMKTLGVQVLTVYFGTPNMFITLWFGFVYGTNPPLGTLII